MTRPRPLTSAVRDALAAESDAEAAATMQAYMKSAMPFRGVAKPAREKLLRSLVAAHPIADADELLAVVRELWDGAAYREERYAALALVGRHQAWTEPSWATALYHDWIVEGGWWDVTDEIANRFVGPQLRAYPGLLTPLMRAWSVDPNRWLRRTSVICQLRSKEDTDLSLLTDAIEANLDDPDFFLRKGIGWALRQHTRTDPAWVRAFVDAHPGLSPLSRREALRRL